MPVKDRYAVAVKVLSYWYTGNVKLFHFITLIILALL